MFILPLQFIAPFGAVRKGFICASQGHLSREQVTRFSRRFFRIPAKWCGNSGTTLAMLPDAKLRANKPDRNGSGKVEIAISGLPSYANHNISTKKL